MRRPRRLATTPRPRIVTDGDVHAPPTSGDYAYNAFTPSALVFPARGTSYTDPVFGTVVHRLTDETGSPSWSDIYSKNGYWNADGSLMVHNTPDGRSILRVPSGDVLLASVPGNDNACFDPINPRAWWWYSFGAVTLNRFDVVDNRNEVVKVFDRALANNGGSIDWIDRSGRYMLLHLGDEWVVYDVLDDVLYDHPIPDTYGSDPGYTGITPDGGYVITTYNGNPNAHRSWKVDHATRSIARDGVVFWTLCGDHGDFVSASDGHNYMVVMECDSVCALYVVDVTIPQSHADKEKQLDDNREVLRLSWSDSMHASRVSRGPLADWCYVSIESGDDVFNGSCDPWRPYQQEIIRVNVVTGAVERLAHHRSRSPFMNYYYQPRLSASWDGSRVAWTSNMNVDLPDGYADVYCLTSTPSPPDPPDPEPPDPEVPLKLYTVRGADREDVVVAASMALAVEVWRAATQATADPTSVTFLSDSVIHADDAEEG